MFTCQSTARNANFYLDLKAAATKLVDFSKPRCSAQQPKLARSRLLFLVLGSGTRKELPSYEQTMSWRLFANQNTSDADD